MGISATVMVADSALTDEDLASLGIVPTRQRIAVEEVLLRNSPDRICVVRAEEFTAIVGMADQIAETVESEHIGFPGTVTVGSAVSSVSYSDFRVFVDGELRRHLCAEDGEVSIDRGEAVEGEERFQFSIEDGASIELDGDVLIDTVLAIAGVAPGTSIFDLSGDEYAPGRTKIGGAEVSRSESIPAETKDSGPRRFMRRILGK